MAIDEYASSVVSIGGGDLKPYRAFAACKDVTDEFILGPPGYKAIQEGREYGESEATGGQRVFIVHGHDHGLKNGVARFVTAVGLEPIILHERPNQGQTVIEKFEREADAGFAVVLCTADDLAESQRALEAHTGSVDKTALRLRARQNVIFELGYFVGRIKRSRVAILLDQDVELPSDLSGVIYISRANWGTELFKAFMDTGYSISQEQSRKALAIQA